MFKPLPVVMAGLLALAGCESGSQPDGQAGARDAAPAVPPEVVQQKVQAARGAIKTFAGALKGELKAALKSGGPAKAIEVCHTRAPEITAQVAMEQGMMLRRVSLKNRNPNNAARGWVKNVLEDFEQKKAAGADPKTLEFQQVVSEDGKPVLRYVKAIPTQKLCLTCHGSDLPEDVAAKLKALYPEDKATGFKVGDIRGAFVVEAPL